jgi:hypothetical protein
MGCTLSPTREPPLFGAIYGVIVGLAAIAQQLVCTAWPMRRPIRAASRSSAQLNPVRSVLLRSALLCGGLLVGLYVGPNMIR